jgi:hypothetical protein
MLECGTAVNLSVSSTLTVSSNSQPRNYVHHTPYFHLHSLPHFILFFSVSAISAHLLGNVVATTLQPARISTTRDIAPDILLCTSASNHSSSSSCSWSIDNFIIFSELIKQLLFTLLANPGPSFLSPRVAIRSFLSQLFRSAQGKSDFSFTRHQTN